MMNTKQDDIARRPREQATRLYDEAMHALGTEAPSIISEIEHAIATVAPRILRARLLRALRPDYDDMSRVRAGDDGRRRKVRP